jgi:hypothetical protein
VPQKSEVVLHAARKGGLHLLKTVGSLVRSAEYEGQCIMTPVDNRSSHLFLGRT